MSGKLPVATAAALAVLALALALAAPARAASNPQLAGLQVALRAYGLYCGPIDGIAGPATAAAVKTFQRRAGLPADGLAGKRTRAALGPLGHPLFGTRTLRRGRIGWDVSVLQFLLHRRGFYKGPYDGYFGAATQKALRRYQRSLKLDADGVAGKATTAAIVLQTGVPVKPNAVATPVSATATRRYVVHPGDSLTALARRFGTSVGALAKLNSLDPSRVLLIGTKLNVPGAAPTRAPASTAQTAPTAAQALAIRQELGVWSSHYGVDPSLARALSWMESGFQADVRSSVGAWGPMQLLPVTWDFVEQSLLHTTVPRTTAGNVQVGVAYLEHLLRQFDGDEQLALAAWYQGERAVREHGLYDETKVFVADVLALRQRM